MLDAWQDAIALSLVAASALVLAQRCRRLLFPRPSAADAPGCPSGCGGCSSHSDRQHGRSQVVTIGFPEPNRPGS